MPAWFRLWCFFSNFVIMTTANEKEGRRVTVIVVAAGSGTRYGSDLPKQFCLLAGRPVLMHTIDAIKAAVPEAAVTVVVSPAMADVWRELCRVHGFPLYPVVAGGATRWESVRNAVRANAPYRPGDIILIQDAARPLTGAETIRGVLEAAIAHGAAVPCVPVTDSLRETDADGGSHAVSRSAFRAVQTPQGFEATMLEEAYRRPYSPSFTDDASVVEAAGHPVTLTPGDACNIKITNPGDMEIALLYMKRR